MSSVKSSSLKDLVDPFRVAKRKKFRLKDFDPADTGKIKSEAQATELLQQSVQLLCELQEKLYAGDKWTLLLIFQAMDAAGKDGTINHVLSGVNPQGCEVTGFKAPSALELDHDFLWRAMKALPERGRIGVFNRSYYEEVLVVRVHPEFLAAQRLPENLIMRNIWKERYEDIRAFERHLSRNGTVIRKFFLNVSKEEQRKRFLARLNEPKKNWKFGPTDVAERHHWDEYMEAYEDMIRQTATKHAPWYVVPADNKWFMRLVVASAIIETLESLDLSFPEVSKAKLKELAAAKRALLGER
ncbi:MAG: polyphosphate kinase 2 family protein [Verrucomicrobiota bacterium]